MVDTRTTEELLAIHPEWHYQRTDRNNTRYFASYICEKCSGHGYIQYYAYIDGGVCFDCGGSGRTDKPKVIKIYTPEYDAKLTANREKRREETLERKRKEFAENINEAMQKLGFGIEDVACLYRVVGNTYEIKDQLKALGCRFNSAVGWYAPSPIDGYETQRLIAEQVCHANNDAFCIEWNNPQEVKELWIENVRAREESTSEWIGKIGERRIFNLHIDRAFESEYHINSYNCCTSYMYLMHDEVGNIIKWSTTSFYKEGMDVKLKATIKDHAEYKGVKQTVITRATRVKE